MGHSLLPFSEQLFNHHEGDVIGLRSSQSEIRNALQNRLLNRVASSRRLPQDDFQKPFFSKHFFLRILGVGETVGINDKQISRVQMKLPGWKTGGLEHSQRESLRSQVFDLSSSRAEQIGRIVPRADELAFAVGAHQEQEKRHELEGKRLIAQELVHPF